MAVDQDVDEVAHPRILDEVKASAVEAKKMMTVACPHISEAVGINQLAAWHAVSCNRGSVSHAKDILTVCDPECAIQALRQIAEPVRSIWQGGGLKFIPVSALQFSFEVDP